MKNDEIRIEIMEDGRIKMDSDRISQPSHASAEAFVREVSRLAGGKTERKAKTKHSHGHHGAHSHEDEHHEH